MLWVENQQGTMPTRMEEVMHRPHRNWVAGLRMLVPRWRREGQWVGQLTGGDRVRTGILDILSLNDVMEECLGQKAERVPHEGRSVLRFPIQFSGPRAILGIESALRKSMSSQ